MTGPDGAGTAIESGRELQAACPLCRSALFRAYVQRPKVLWVRCECGLIYKKWTAEPAGTRAAFDPLNTTYARRWRRRVAKSRHQIRDVLNHVPAGPALDVGCSLGYTLQAARALGMCATGLEYDPDIVAFCRSRGFQVEVGTMTAMPFAADSFQLVVMKHVLEHTGAPRAALREVRRTLRPGGGLFIAVPHAGYGKAQRAPATSRFYKYSDPDTGHAIYYTPATLARLVGEEGFDVVRIHPHLVHRRVPLPLKLAQVATFPLRWVIERLRDMLHIRKEFWLVAVKSDRGS